MKGLLFTYAMTYGGAVASLFNPFVGLLVYVCFAIIKPESLWYWAVPEGNYSRVVGVALLLGWMFRGFGVWRFGRASGVVAALSGFMGWSAVGYLLAPDKGKAWVFVEALAKIVLPFLVGITTIDSVRKLKQLVWVIVLSQGYVAYELNMTYLGGYNRLQETGFGGIDNNGYAIGLLIATGLAFFLGLAERVWWHKVLSWGAAGCCGHAVLLSFSRGAMLGVIVTGAMSFWLIPKRPKHYAAAAVALALGLRLAGPQVQERFATVFSSREERDVSAASRLDLWKACLECAARNPVTGLGPNHWPLVAHEFGFTVGKSAHSTWMETAAEQGVPGFALLAAFYVLCIAQLWPMRHDSYPVVDPWLHEAARMVIAGLVGFVVAAQFVTLHGLEIPYYTTLVGAGILKLNSAGRGDRAAGPLGSSA
jgi:probable O-glycosylation ligase (exosortase A-associated)